jgi:hypothetical protein
MIIDVALELLREQEEPGESAAAPGGDRVASA